CAGEIWPAAVDAASIQHGSQRTERTRRVCGTTNERQMTVPPRRGRGHSTLHERGEASMQSACGGASLVMVRSCGREHDVCRRAVMRSTSRGSLVAVLVMVVAGIGVAAAEHYAKVGEIKIGGAGAFD